MDNLDADLRIVIAEMQAEIARRIEARQAALAHRMADLAAEGARIALHAEWKEIPLVFHLPSATLKDQRMPLALPELTLDEWDLVVQTPALRLVQRKVGQYPEFHGFSLRWKDVFGTVPEVVMEEQRMRMALPAFASREREVLLRVPQVAMVENRIVLKLPQFGLRVADPLPADLQAAADQARQDTEAGIRADLKEVGELSQERVVGCVARVFDAARTRLRQQREQSLHLFDHLIATLRTTLEDLRRRSARAEFAATLEAGLSQAVSERAVAAAAFDGESAQLDEQEQQVVRDMLERLAFRLTDVPAPDGAARMFTLARRPLGALQLVPRATPALPG